MDGFLAGFVLGAAGWWIISIGCFIWLIIAVEKHSWISSLICAVLYIVFMQFLAKSDLFGHVIKHPLATFLYILSYFVIGFTWSFVKWWLFVGKLMEKRAQLNKKFLNEYKTRNRESEMNSKDMKEKWATELRYADLDKTSISENKTKISVWVMYWPISLIWSLVDDLIKKIIKQLVIFFKGIYDAITNIMMRGVDEVEKQKMLIKIEEEKKEK
jgi:hypothetical protein